MTAQSGRLHVWFFLPMERLLRKNAGAGIRGEMISSLGFGDDAAFTTWPGVDKGEMGAEINTAFV